MQHVLTGEAACGLLTAVMRRMNRAALPATVAVSEWLLGWGGHARAR